MRKVDLLFFIILLLMFLGSFSPAFTYISMVLVAFISLYIGHVYYKKPSWTLCKMILILLIFQNLMIGCGAHLSGNTNDSLKYITQVPFITTIVIWFCFFINNIKKRMKINFISKSFILLLLCIIFLLLLEEGQ